MLNNQCKIFHTVLFMLLLAIQSNLIAQDVLITNIYRQDHIKDQVTIGYNFIGDSTHNYNIKFCIKDSILPNFIFVPGIMKGAIGKGKFANRRNYITIPKDQIPKEFDEKIYYQITAEEVRDSIIFGDVNKVSQQYNSSIEDGISITMGIEPQNNKIQYIQNGAKSFDDYCMRVLRIPGNKRRCLLNNDVWIESLKYYFKLDGWVQNNIKDGRTDVFIYFAGQCKVNENNHRIYLLPPGSTEGISLDELISQLEGFNPKNVYFFIEPFIVNNSVSKDANYYYPGYFSDKIHMMMSCRWDQKSYNIEEESMSLFSFEILKGLSGYADLNKDKNITFNELYEYVKKNVWDYSVNILNKEQDPILIPNLEKNGSKTDLILIERK
jgi:hypothetical protein